MSENKKLMPELRFPEFINDGEWDEKVLDEICDITNGKANVQDHVDNGKYPLFDRSEIIKASNDFIFDCEAVIIPGEGMRFIPKYYQGKFNLHQRAYALKDFVCNGRFVYYWMLYKSALLSRKAVQSTVLSLRLPILQTFPIDIPKNPEDQQKIASCLSSLDEVIDAHSQKLELLKKHKKGLMQNLFPQRGGTVPKYRFPEFDNDGEWKEKKLGEIAENLDFRRVPITSTLRERGDIPYYGASGIIDYVKDYIFDEPLLCISEDGANLIDRNYPIAFTITGKTWVNNHAHVLKFKNSDTQTLIEKYINSINVEEFLTGMAQPKLNRAKLDIIPVLLPENPKEQQKIAFCLSALDELIVAQAKKIEQLRLHKKGLMQGLFPQIDN
jgi:type I restriction enzyme S subunit